MKKFLVMVKNKELARKQLDVTLKRLEPLKTLMPPPKGWIRAIRSALAMNGRQLAGRLGVSPARVTALEQDEAAGRVTINTMKHVAEALDCVYVYALVPRSSLENTLREKAKRLVEKRMQRISHTMALEDQSLSPADEEKALEAAIDQILLTTPKTLWDE